MESCFDVIVFFLQNFFAIARVYKLIKFRGSHQCGAECLESLSVLSIFVEVPALSYHKRLMLRSAYATFHRLRDRPLSPQSKDHRASGSKICQPKAPGRLYDALGPCIYSRDRVFSGQASTPALSANHAAPRNWVTGIG